MRKLRTMLRSIIASSAIQKKEKKWEKKYGHLKHGDTFPLDGPAKLFYNYDPSGLDVRFYSTYMHMGEKSLTSFHLKIYL